MKNHSVKVTIRPVKAKALQEETTEAYRNYVHSHMIAGGKTHCHKTNVVILGDYRGTREAEDAWHAAHLRWAEVSNGPFITVAYD